MHLALRYSLGDWAACVLLFCVGLYLDRAKPFEQYIGNRLADPSISYPHTPPEQQQVTANQLIFIALVFPACAIGGTQLLLRRRRSSDLNQALLGLLSSVALALTLVCFVKNAYGRLPAPTWDRRWWRGASRSLVATRPYRWRVRHTSRCGSGPSSCTPSCPPRWRWEGRCGG